MAAEPTPTPLRVAIKPMKRRHINQAYEIEHLASPGGWTRSIFLSELLYAAERTYIVAKHGRRVVGFAGVWCTPDEGHITNIVVHPEWRRHKVASRMLAHLIGVTADRGLDAMTLEVRVSNRAAQAMYERFGFASVGIRPGYYGDNREDAVIMWARDIRSTVFRARVAEILTAIDEARGGR